MADQWQAMFFFLIDNPEVVMAGFAGLIVVLIGLFFMVAVQNRRLKRSYQKIFGEGGDTGKNLEERLWEHHHLAEKILQGQLLLERRLDALEQSLTECIQKVGVVRFNAFPDIGSDLSFAVALLNQYNHGVVFSSIYGRSDSRIFVKPIQEGTSRYRLSEEEKMAITQAMTKKGQEDSNTVVLP